MANATYREIEKPASSDESEWRRWMGDNYSQISLLFLNIGKRFGFGGHFADDVVSKAFENLWIGRQSYDSSKPMSIWLGVIARNAGRDLLRKIKRDEKVINFTHASGAEQYVQEELETPYERALVGERDSQVMEAFGELGENHRIVMQLAYIDGVEEGDIANMLGIPRGTVKSRLYAGRKILAGRLERLG